MAEAALLPARRAFALTEPPRAKRLGNRGFPSIPAFEVVNGRAARAAWLPGIIACRGSCLSLN
jgi:hypothetical protein